LPRHASLVRLMRNHVRQASLVSLPRRVGASIMNRPGRVPAVVFIHGGSQRIRQLVMDIASDVLANESLNRDFELNSIDHLRAIRCPTLVLIGDQDVPDIRGIVDRLAAGIPGARREVIKDSGHIVHMAQPAQFDRVVLDFLKSGT